MKNSKKKYVKPSFEAKTIKLNYFYASRRSRDSLNSLFNYNFEVLASSCGGCGSGGSKSVEDPI